MHTYSVYIYIYKYIYILPPERPGLDKYQTPFNVKTNATAYSLILSGQYSLILRYCHSKFNFQTSLHPIQREDKCYSVLVDSILSGDIVLTISLILRYCHATTLSFNIQRLQTSLHPIQRLDTCYSLLVDSMLLSRQHR